MHPLDSSLDASLHDQPRVPTRRRTSIDNGCLATNGELMLKLISSAGSADHEYHRHTLRPRRLSLNNVNSLPTTFLASLNYKTSNTKTDLDLDCHSSLHESRHGCSSQTRSSKHSTTTRTGTTISGHRQGTCPSTAAYNGNRATETDEPMTVSDDNDSFDPEQDDDSFCDASFAEPANLDYIQRDLGASCLWDDEDDFRQDKFRHVEQRRSSGIKGIDSNDNNNMSDFDYFYGEEPNMGGSGTDHTSRNSIANSQLAMGDDDDDDDDDYDVAVGIQSHQLQRGHADHYHDDDESLSGGFDDESSEDSFCDAHDFERANKEYLTTDLGASVFWNSKDMIHMDTDNTCAGVGIETISEAEELADH